MKYIVEITHQAETEADKAYEYICKESPTSAYNWFEGLQEAVDSLTTFPERCATAPESEDVGQEIRCLLYGDFRILFSIDSSVVSILHIRHGRQRHLGRDNF